MPETIGDYSLESVLGRGAMGTVYRARHKPTGAIRAVKVIAGTADEELLARFRREANALARAGGEGVVPIHEAGFDRGRLFLVMGLMSNGSLRDRVGKVDWREAAGIAVALGRALERCHAAGLVHRDLKPDNVLFDEQGRPRLADFGLVRDLGALDLTRSGLMVGTPAYMAPEQLEGQRVDRRADIYALGSVLEELISGVVPLLGNDLGQTLALKARGRPSSLHQRLGAPRELDRVLDRALAPRLDDRYPTAAELCRDLEALLGGQKVSATPRRSKRPLAAGIAAGILVAGALTLVATRGPSPSGDLAPAAKPTPSPVLPLAPSPSSKTVEATHLIQRATSELDSREGMERVQGRVDRALEISAVDSLARADVDAFVAACRNRVSSPVPAVLDAEGMDHFFRPAFAAIRLARRFGAQIEPSEEFVDRAGDWAHLFRDCRDKDWCLEGLEAFRFAMRREAHLGRDAGHGASALRRLHKELAPELRGVLEEIEVVMLPRERAAFVEVHAEFLASDGRWDEALHAVLAAAPTIPGRNDRKQLAYALQRAGLSSKTPLDPALLDAVVNAYPDSPEFLMLRVLFRDAAEDDKHLEDVEGAAASEILEAPLRAIAFWRLAHAYDRRGDDASCAASYDRRPERVSELLRTNADDVKRHARALLRLGHQSKAAAALEEAGGDFLALVAEARAAKTPDARGALVEKLR